ncbi:hypothetical protein E3G69_001355 [Mycobacteroides abscessus]|nr:hypothetical protein [Mycobacteroides abscessus]QOF42328.1 hypothetical protein E3G69_001355 [Mycobacteroides abscessus]QOF47026.1 hypothetical protein E3G70_001353 [Mycobacteroides abscessus]
MVLFGLFMILLDSTIVSVANPAIKAGFGADYSSTVWVTSAYLLGYAVPLLITGRLGDQFGPRSMYLSGLAVFTAASLWCGLAGSIGWLIAARVVQGIGAAMLTPQTLTVVQRVFPPERRGTAMGVWGAVAGIATLVGPVAGGLLVDGWGWQWIFYVNVPVGVLGIILGAIYIPRMPTHRHRLDLLGMALSAVGMFAFVFALQEGESFHWAPGVWAMMAAGLVVLGVFVWWQSANRGGAADPVAIVRRPQLFARRRRYRVDEFLCDLDRSAHDVLYATGTRLFADKGGVDPGAHGDCEWNSGAPSRMAGRQGASIDTDRRRYRVDDRLDAVVDAVDAA